jgi:[ribosomal protein S18]-alanine N-acetyltransferase
MILPEFRVRVGEVKDLAAVVAMERRIAEAPHWPEEEYTAIAGGGHDHGSVRRCLMVAEGQDGLLGFAVGKAVGSGKETFAELESVAVDGGARRLGVGRTVCEAVLVWCRAQGAVMVELEVRAGSAGAIALYQGLGFVETGRRARYYQEPVEDGLLMRVNLN